MISSQQGQQHPSQGGGMPGMNPGVVMGPGGPVLQPPATMEGQGSVEMLQKALDAVKMLRCNVTALFETIATGPKLEGNSGTTTQEERERAFKSEFTVFMQRMVDNVKEMDANISGMTQPVGPFNLGNSSFVNQEVAPERIPLYSQLVDSYKWMEKVHEYSGVACPILSQNSMKRTYFSTSLSAKRRRPLINNYVVAPETVNSTINGISNSYNDMKILITRPLGTNAALNVTLGRTLTAVVILKGWLIEWVVVRGVLEEMMKEDGSLDFWTESRYKVFQKVTDNANAAMLHFCAPTHPELSVRSFMPIKIQLLTFQTWLHSYITLFTQPCKKCQLHLNNNLPPTWRDLRSLEPYHEECKP